MSNGCFTETPGGEGGGGAYKTKSDTEPHKVTLGQVIKRSVKGVGFKKQLAGGEGRGGEGWRGNSRVWGLGSWRPACPRWSGKKIRTWKRAEHRDPGSVLGLEELQRWERGRGGWRRNLKTRVRMFITVTLLNRESL